MRKVKTKDIKYPEFTYVYFNFFTVGKNHKGHMSDKNIREIRAKTTTQALTKD